MKDLKYLLAYLVPLLGWFGLTFQGLWCWSALVFAFGAIPVFDAILPASTANFSPQEESSRAKNYFFDWLLYACVPVTYFFVWQYFGLLKSGVLGTAETVGLTLSIGVVFGSMGINIAHELGHRPGRMEQSLSKMLLLPVLYMHFFIEHNRGHHKHVATDQDPASAKRSENLYAFWLRSIFGQFVGAWRIETERLAKENKRVFGPHNQFLVFLFFEIAWLLAVGLVFGLEIVPFALAVALFAVLMLETVNYIEHYGLRRRLLDSGRLEPVEPRHSWNSDHEMGRIFLFELTRHSDHHFKSTRPFQVLRHLDDSPQLPQGYPASMLLAMVPPLWFRVMNPRLAVAD